MSGPLRVGVVGLGVIARFHLAALAASPDWDLVAVCDLDPARALEPRPGVTGYTDHTRMLAEAGLDAVVVTAPNDTHARICADALTAGAAVCVEKPLALDLAEGEALAALARERGVPLTTAFHRRHNSEFAALRERIGGRTVTEVTVRYLERIEEHAGSDTWYLDPERCGGGCVADNGPNAFNLVEALLGRAEVTGARVGYDEAGWTGGPTSRWSPGGPGPGCSWTGPIPVSARTSRCARPTAGCGRLTCCPGAPPSRSRCGTSTRASPPSSPGGRAGPGRWARTVCRSCAWSVRSTGRRYSRRGRGGEPVRGRAQTRGDR